MKSDSFNMTEQSMAVKYVNSMKDGIASDPASFMSVSAGATPGIKRYNGGRDDHHADNFHTKIHSDDGSLAHIMPQYNHHATESFKFEDGQCTSCTHVQPAVSYGSEAFPSHSWGATFLRDAPTGATMTSSEIPHASSRINGLNSSRFSGAAVCKTSALPLDSKFCQYTATSDFSASHFHTRSLQPLNKAASQYDGPMNYTPAGRAWYGSDRYKFRGKTSRNVSFEAIPEHSRGPRAQKRSTVNPLVENNVLGATIRRDQYNRQDFQVPNEMAKFFVIKSFSEDDVHKSIKYNVWSSTPNGNKKLNTAFQSIEANSSDKECPIFLFFSVNGSGQFLGMAELIGPVDFNKNMDFWQLDKWNGFFPVKWHIIKDIPNSQLRHIILENNDNKPVTRSRDTQEIGLKQGLEMLDIFKQYSSKGSILDDFAFYENQKKLDHGIDGSSSSSRPTSHQSSCNDLAHQGRGPAVSPLIRATRDLSLNGGPWQQHTTRAQFQRQPLNYQTRMYG